VCTSQHTAEKDTLELFFKVRIGIRRKEKRSQGIPGGKSWEHLYPLAVGSNGEKWNDAGI
jgi:hypothetical protein